MRFEPLESRAKRVVITLVVSIVVDALVGIHAIVDILLLNKAIADPEAVSQSRLELSDAIIAIGGTLQLLVFIVVVVFFLLWFHRAATNLRAFVSRPRDSPGWAVGSWFVPIANLFVPKRAANDMWRAGRPQDHYPSVIDWWWAFWLISSFLGNIVGRVYWRAEELEEFRTADYLDVATSVMSIVAALLCIKVVREITRRQGERADVPFDPQSPERPPGTAPRFERDADDDEFTIEPGWKPVPSD